MKLLFVTGGVVSWLGKWITSASIGRVLKSAGYKVNMIKIDPYLQVDAGTMSPYEHGEVYVTKDGAETDLDIGNYERFVDLNLEADNNITTGKVYLSVIQKERRGDYLGRTVQVIPHVTNEIKERIISTAKKADITVIEVWGTVGDIESPHFFEAIRQLKLDLGRENIGYIHTVPLLHLKHSDELKTKPIQHSVRDLRSLGIQPDILVCRTEFLMGQGIREKISLMCSIDNENIIEAVNADTIYDIPLLFQEQSLERVLEKILNLKQRKSNLRDWKKFVQWVKQPSWKTKIAIIGKYAGFKDAYASLSEAIIHAGANQDVQVDIEWIESDALEKDFSLLTDLHKANQLQGIIVPGGFGKRWSLGKIQAIQYVRENNIPFLGICLGFQMAVIEFARNVCNIYDADSTEFKPNGTPVIDYLPDQDDSTEKWGTMRLGDYEAILKKDSKIYKIYKNVERVTERHRHRYEVNQEFHKILEKNGLIFSGKSEDGRLAEFLEIKNHPCFIATQAHPEFTSRPNKPNPMFDYFILSSKQYYV